MNDFEGKLVYITGGSSGIGLAMAKLFASQGASLALLARNKNKLAAAKKEVEASRRGPSQSVLTLSVNVADHRDVIAKTRSAVEKFGLPDILVCSAGTNKWADHFANITFDRFDEVVQTNLYGVRNVIHALLGPLKEKKGRVVILSSAAGLFGMFGYTAYGTSKAALLGFADSLRYELKPLGVSVTVVCPPEVDTPMNLDEAKTLPAEGRAVKNLGGMLTPDFVARVIMKAVAKKKYLVIPGFQTRFLYLMHRLTNGWMTRVVADAVIAGARRKAGR